MKLILTITLLISSLLHAATNDHQQSDALLAEAARLAPAFTPTAQQILPPTPEQCQGLGSWGAIIPWTPHLPVTCAQLPDGRLLTFASDERTTFPNNNERTYAATWDYRTGVFVEINNPRHDMFCGGISMLPDGRVLVNGGNGSDPRTSIFDWRTNSWVVQPDMNDFRWYNTSVALPDGTAFTAAGTGGTDTTERWRDGSGWSRITGINWALVHGEGGEQSIWHPFLHIAPNGLIAHTGPTKSLHWVDPYGNGQLTDTGVDNPNSNYYPKDGSLVMYDIGKILFAAGSDGAGQPSNLSYVVDINGASPTVTQTSSLASARTFSNGVVLPNGEVMVIGGNSGANFSDANSVLTPEIWNPTTGQWRVAANASVPRNYHSLAVLLPDGRVWSGGSGLSGNSADHRDAQIYTPGCLFKADGSAATRPVITAAPSAIGLGMAFSVQATTGMRNFTFIKMNSLTHSVSSDLRFINLPFTEDTPGNYTVHSHINQNVMTPGYWMLFAISPSGPFSISKTIQVDTSITQSINNPGDQNNFVGATVSLPIVASGYNLATRVFTATGLPTSLSINPSSGIISGTASAAGLYNVTAQVSDGVSQSTSTSFKWTIQPQVPLALAPLSGPPVLVQTAITYTASTTGGLNPQFQWNFGDGSPSTAFSSAKTITKTYTTPGRYIVTLTARDTTGSELSTSFRQAIHAPLTTSQPTVSSSIAYQTGTTARLWVVNPDQDSVTVFDATTRARTAIINVGKGPRSIAIAPDGRAWVVNSESATISIIGTNLAVAQTVTLRRGSRPFAIVFDPAGNSAYVSLQDTGNVLKISRASTSTLGSINVGSDVRHLSVSADGSKVFATRFITPKLPGEETAIVTTQQGNTKYGGQVAIITSSTMTVAKTVILEHSNDLDSTIAGRGIPNYLGPAVLSPDGRTAWVPSKKDNIKRGMLRDGRPLTHDSAVRSISSRIDLATESEDFSARIDFNDGGIASTACFERTGIYAFTALEGSREIAVIDSLGKSEIVRFTVGRAPQGVVTSPDGRTLFVHNFMDRTVTVHDVSNIITGAETQPSLTATLACITTEKLSAALLNGKQLFYDANDQRLALQRYISCASCHNDGGHDGRTWDFTGFDEGLRNNISLKGHGSHGPVHWTGNFDEIQDFEGQIRNFAGGLGLISNGTPHPSLGTPNAGRSADLDALAAYVTSLTTTGNSPGRNTNGTITTEAAAGQTLFKAQNCASCHSGARFTNSALGVFADIGTIKPSSGKRLNATLTGLDVPTLRGLWNTAPYLHDGSATTVSAAITAHQGTTLTSTQLSQLSAYLSQIEDSTTAAPAPLQIVLATANTSVNGPFAVTGVLSEAATGFTVSDISITGGTISGFTLTGTNFNFNVTPAATNIQISIAANTMTDSIGIANLASNILSITTGPDVTKPAIVLATASTAAAAPFSVSIQASENITGLALSDFTVTNGTASQLTGNSAAYSILITPTTTGAVTVNLPANTVTDTAGNANTASNTLSVTYTKTTVTTTKIEAEDFDQGAEGVAYHDTDTTNVGNTYRLNTGVDIELSEDTDGTPSIGWTVAGEWLHFTKTLTPGTYTFRARAASAFTGPSQIRILINGAVATTFSVGSTIDWNIWQTFTQTGINVTANGSSTIRVEFLNGNVNLNWLELINTNGTPDTAKPAVTLATASTTITGPFTVNTTFSEPVAGVALSDFTVTNGTASQLTGSNAIYSVLMTPTSNGIVTVAMPAAAASDTSGNTNTASNTLSVNYTLTTITTTKIEAEDFDQGAEGVAYHDTDTTNVGNTYRPYTGLDIENSEDTDGTPSIGWTVAGEWLHFTKTLTPGTYTFRARAASAFSGPSQIRILINGAVATTFSVGSTTDWNIWQTFTQTGINVTANGSSTIRVEFLNGNVNLNWLELINTASPAGSDALTNAPVTNPISGSTSLTISNSTVSFPHSAAADASGWSLESSTDLKTWTPLNLTPSITNNADGTASHSWPLPDQPTGIIRLKFGTQSSAPVGWHHLTLQAGIQSVGINFTRPPVFTGTVEYLSAVTLEPTTRHYLEILSGPYAGHRFDLIDATNIDTSSPNNTLLQPPSSLAGAQLSIIPHTTLSQAFPKASLRASTNPDTADQVIFYAAGVYQPHWLNTTNGWTSETNLNSDDIIILPGTGLMFKSALANTRRLTLNGNVRTTPFAVRLQEGNQLLTQPWPLTASPQILGMLTGFISSPSRFSADSMQLWNGDATPNSTTYTGLWFMKNAITASNIWVLTLNPTVNQNAASLLPAGRAFYFKPAPNVIRTAWLIPAP